MVGDVVVTSVNRDERLDGGAEQFAFTIQELRKRLPDAAIEVLIPDFKGDREALQTVMDASPEVLNHNTETVLRLQRDIRTSASYGRSLALLWRAKQMRPDGLTKSGLIVGMGETREEVLATLADMRAVGIDIITIGQYLRPTAKHRPIHRYVHPDEFAEYKAFGEAMGSVLGTEQLEVLKEIRDELRERNHPGAGGSGELDPGVRVGAGNTDQ